MVDNISGSKFDGQSLLSCEYLCDSDPLCKGLFFATSGCYTLHKLVECSTSLSGDSYTRNMTAPLHGHHTGPPPAAVSSEEEVRAKVRLASNLSVAAVHYVDWRHAMPAVWSSGVLPSTVFGPFTLNISNAILSTPPDGDQPPATSLVQPQCGGLHLTLHQLDQPSQQVEGVCDAVAGVTVLVLPSPAPWGLVEVRRATAAPCAKALMVACPAGGDGGSAIGVMQCNECIGRHQAPLRAAGCSSTKVQEWCSHQQRPKPDILE